MRFYCKCAQLQREIDPNQGIIRKKQSLFKIRKATDGLQSQIICQGAKFNDQFYLLELPSVQFPQASRSVELESKRENEKVVGKIKENFPELECVAFSVKSTVVIIFGCIQRLMFSTPE